MTLKHLIFQIVQYTEYHCIRVQRIPASKSTSTKTIHFSFQFYTIVIQNQNFDDDLINMLREDFSDAPMMNEAREELLHMCQKPEEQMHVYVYRYGRMHQRSSGIRAADETHQHVIQDFVKSLKPKIKNKFANKFAECRFQPRTLEQAFSLALDLEKKIQIANSFRDDIMDSRTPTTVNGGPVFSPG